MKTVPTTMATAAWSRGAARGALGTVASYLDAASGAAVAAAFPTGAANRI